MKTLLQINTVVNTGSTGRIAEGIGITALENGWKSYIAYGRYGNSSKSSIIKIGSKLDNYTQLLYTRLFDKHGYNSKRATKKFIRKIEKIKPDIIHLHNIHGYYLNLEILFNYLASIKTPIIWTLHDCWAYTGHCTHYSYVNCQKWQTHCENCPQIGQYPKSYNDNSFKNFDLKKKLFNSIQNLTLVPVSKWLEGEVRMSFLSQNNIYQIYNGIDVEQFKPINPQNIKTKLGIENEFIILGVASTWSDRKGFKDFMELSKLLEKGYLIILIGLSKEQLKGLPPNILGIARTESIVDLAELYNVADVFVNPTWEDNFPTTNIEAMACGTPVITYATGGSIEAVNSETGWIVEQGNISEIYKLILEINVAKLCGYKRASRERVVNYFNKIDRFKDYLYLFNNFLNK